MAGVGLPDKELGLRLLRAGAGGQDADPPGGVVVHHAAVVIPKHVPGKANEDDEGKL